MHFIKVCLFLLFHHLLFVKAFLNVRSKVCGSSVKHAPDGLLC